MTTFLGGHAVRWDIEDSAEAWDVDVLAAFSQLEIQRQQLEQASRDRGCGYVVVEPWPAHLVGRFHAAQSGRSFSETAKIGRPASSRASFSFADRLQVRPRLPLTCTYAASADSHSAEKEAR